MSTRIGDGAAKAPRPGARSTRHSIPHRSQVVLMSLSEECARFYDAHPEDHNAALPGRGQGGDADSTRYNRQASSSETGEKDEDGHGSGLRGDVVMVLGAGAERRSADPDRPLDRLRRRPRRHAPDG